MKIFTIIFLCFIPFLICDGVRIAINEKFIDALLKNFLPEIQQYTSGTEIPDYSILERMTFSIPNFSLDKINLSFTEQGLLNVKVNELEPVIIGRAKKKIIVDFEKSFVLTLKKFNFDGNLKIGTKNDNGVLVPDVYFDSEPTMDFSPKINLGDNILEEAVSAIFNGVTFVAKIFIIPAIKKQIDDILAEIVLKIPKEIDIMGYKLDITLSSDIQLRNKFLEINSNARLFDPNIPETKTKYFESVYFPNITSVENQLKIYASEYSVNAAIYTLLVSEYNTISTSISKDYVKMVIPQIDNYKEDPQIILTCEPNFSLQITEQSLNVNLSGSIAIEVQNEIIIKLDVKVMLKAKGRIQEEEKMSAEIIDFDLNVNKIDANIFSVDINKILISLPALKPTLISIANKFIKSQLEISIPTFFGIKFTELRLEHKNHYLEINYNLVRT